jgi:hypothetical protein
VLTFLSPLLPLSFLGTLERWLAILIPLYRSSDLGLNSGVLHTLFSVRSDERSAFSRVRNLVDRLHVVGGRRDDDSSAVVRAEIVEVFGYRDRFSDQIAIIDLDEETLVRVALGRGSGGRISCILALCVSLDTNGPKVRYLLRRDDEKRLR